MSTPAADTAAATAPLAVFPGTHGSEGGTRIIAEACLCASDSQVARDVELDGLKPSSFGLPREQIPVHWPIDGQGPRFSSALPFRSAPTTGTMQC